MTINWVMKRAELVLKCIKGFMIEFVQWGAQESRTLQFVLPQELLNETFDSLSNLIKLIFRESRTVDLNWISNILNIQIFQFVHLFFSSFFLFTSFYFVYLFNTKQKLL